MNQDILANSIYQRGWMISDIIVIAIEVGVLAVVFGFVYVLGNVALKTFVSSKSDIQQTIAVKSRRKFSALLLLIFTVACLCLVSANGYLIYRNEGVLDTQMMLLRSVPREFWDNLGLAVAQCLMLALLVKVLLRTFIHSAIRAISTAAKNVDSIQANDKSIEQLFQLLDRVVSVGLWLACAIASIQLLRLPEQAVAFSYWFFGIYVAIALGMLSLKVIPIMIDTLDALSLRFSETQTPLRFYQKFRYLIPAFKQCLELVIYVGVASLIVRHSAPLTWLPLVTHKIVSVIAVKIIGIIAVYFLTRLAIEIVSVTVDEFMRRSKSSSKEQLQRRLTIAPLLKDCLRYLVYFGAIVSVLSLIEIDPTPILAGAGILGLAVGFGAQNFVEDIVSGFLILFENYYLVGDYIAAGRLEERPVEGVVEVIELRTTKLRHPDGQVQIVRNGEIGSVVNYSKQYIYATVDIPFAADTNLQDVYPIIDKVGERLKQDRPEVVIEGTQVEGLENLGKSLILLRTTTKVKPGQHLHIKRVLRKLLKDAFDQSNIELTDYTPMISADAKDKF